MVPVKVTLGRGTVFIQTVALPVIVAEGKGATITVLDIVSLKQPGVVIDAYLTI